MLYHCYLKKGFIYIPTVVNQGTAVYMDVEPVTVASIADVERLRCTLRDTIPERNDFLAPSVEDAHRPAVVLKYTGDRSWAAFTRTASYWSIYEKGGNYQIEGHKRRPGTGSWTPDPERTIKFPSGTKVDEVIDRMVTILQDSTTEAAR
jgi:hypothetical protein